MSYDKKKEKKKITKSQVVMLILGLLGFAGGCFICYQFGFTNGKKNVNTDKAFQTGLALGKSIGSKRALELIPGNAPEAWESLQKAIERNYSLRSGLTDLILSYDYYRASEGM